MHSSSAGKSVGIAIAGLPSSVAPKVFNNVNNKMFTLSELATVAKVVMKSTPHDVVDIGTGAAATGAMGAGSGFDANYVPANGAPMQAKANHPCFTNCSGHGLCHEGECWCEVQFRGSSCQSTNFVYYTVFSCLFFLLSIVSLVQLAVCIQAEYHKRHKPCLRDALRVTNQKLVYIFVTIATASRGLYFAIQLSHPVISFNLQTVYYPLILTIFSLIVCQWAESFHINDMGPQNQSNCPPGGGTMTASRHSQQVQQSGGRSEGTNYSRGSSFLTKSLGAFITFNVIMYILLFLQLLATNTWVKDIAGKKYWMRISKACFASLTLLVVVFFLIYGVEMFFKVRGAFVDANQRLNRHVACSSRLSLIFQAGFLLFLAMFLFSDVAFIHFEQKITDLGISYFDTACRAVDLCVAIWFPIVLWKSAQPDELWLLNPKFLLHKPQQGSPDVVTICSSVPSPCSSTSKGNGISGSNPVLYVRSLSHESSCDVRDSHSGDDWSQHSSVTVKSQECFICYDTERDDAGPLINPCKCKGDTSVVHHDCLRRWILESLGGFSNDNQESFTSNTADTNFTSGDFSSDRRNRPFFGGLFSSSGYASCSQSADSRPASSNLAGTSSSSEGEEQWRQNNNSLEQRGSSIDRFEGNQGSSTSNDGMDLQSSSFNRRMDLQNFRLNSGALGLLLGGSDNANLRCKVCNQPYQLQTSFMIQCQAHNWKLWLKWVVGLAAMTAMPFAVSAVFQFTTEPAPRVLALALLFLFEYALWRLAGFNLVTLYNYAKFSSFRIEGKEVKVRSSVTVTPSPQPTIPTAQIIPPSSSAPGDPMMYNTPTSGATSSFETSVAEIEEQPSDLACMQDNLGIESSQEKESLTESVEICESEGDGNVSCEGIVARASEEVVSGESNTPSAETEIYLKATISCGSCECPTTV